MAVLEWTRPARCEDCKFCESYHKWSERLKRPYMNYSYRCSLGKREGFFDKKNKVCNEWKYKYE